jgi:hypothetical protein
MGLIRILHSNITLYLAIFGVVQMYVVVGSMVYNKLQSDLTSNIFNFMNDIMNPTSIIPNSPGFYVSYSFGLASWLYILYRIIRKIVSLA